MKMETEEIRCPLCDYNLRGLKRPRCPECGYLFHWPEILDPTRRIHRYLYEHHPEREFRSIAQTILGSLRPVRFWKSLHAAQLVNSSRLLSYWRITLLGAALALCITTLTTLIADMYRILSACTGVVDQ